MRDILGEFLVKMDNSKMSFGKHKGVMLQDVPRDYIQWLASSGDGPLQVALELYLEETKE